MLIRSAQPEDAPAVARVHVRAWQVGYSNLLAKEYLDSLDPDVRARRYDFGSTDPLKPRTFLALDDATVVGFATISPAREFDQAGWGELCALYVDPDHWGHGIGSRLLIHAEAQLVNMGYRCAILWVLKGNTKAERFYQAQGWMADGHCRSEMVWGATAEEVRYQRRLDRST